MGFNSESIEFFYNAGLTPFPLAKIPSMTMKIGALASNAIIDVSDVIFFCGKLGKGGIGVYKYDGTLTKISLNKLDRLMQCVLETEINMSAFKMYGLTFVNVNLSSYFTMCYCIEEETWFEWESTSSISSNMRFAIGSANDQSTESYGISLTSMDTGIVGIVSAVSPIPYNDNGSNAFTATIQTKNDDMGTTKQKTYNTLDLVCDKETSASTTTISYSDDDYQNFTTAGTLDISTTSLTLTGLGTSKKRAWKITNAANTPMRIEAIELDVDIGR
jgi:hypothetical protein